MDTTTHQKDTTMSAQTTHLYIQPITLEPIPCRLISRQTGHNGRKTATIIIPAEHSKMTKDGQPVDVELTVADRSVVEG